jgi:hypothetical protein
MRAVCALGRCVIACPKYTLHMRPA